MAKKKVTILSLDGGGIRGILSGEVVVALERELQRQSKSDDRIGDYFDFIAGTSTGGIMAAAYLLPGHNNKARFRAADVMGLYIEKGDQIFEQNEIRSWISYIYNERYDANNLEEELQLFFGDAKLSELLRPCLITSYNIESRNAKLFNQALAGRADMDFYVRDVVRATSAAPTYFEPAKICAIDDDVPYHLVDGGVYANNPALCAYAEVRKMIFKKHGPDINQPMAKDMLMISIGTGEVKQGYRYDDLKDAGAMKWVKPLIDILMSANAETVSYQLRRMYDTLAPEDRNDYYRLEPKLVTASAEMDDVSDRNIGDLQRDGREFAEANRELIAEIAEKVLRYR
ncbi:MAG: patatin-like phospholipase family protein [Chitinophagales bacterium]